MDHGGYGLQREQELALKNAGIELPQNTQNAQIPPTPQIQGYTHFLLSHFGKFIQKGKVLGEVFAVGFHAVLHDGQQGLHEARDARAAPDVLHWPIHVIRAGSKQQQPAWVFHTQSHPQTVHTKGFTKIPALSCSQSSHPYPQPA